MIKCKHCGAAMKEGAAKLFCPNIRCCHTEKIPEGYALDDSIFRERDDRCLVADFEDGRVIKCWRGDGMYAFQLSNKDKVETVCLSPEAVLTMVDMVIKFEGV